MIRIEQIKMKTSHTKAELKKKVGHILGVSGEEITGMEIIKRSIDARKKRKFIMSIQWMWLCQRRKSGRS